MFLKSLNQILLALLAVFFVSSCATTGSDLNASNAIKSSGNWYPISVATNGDVSYFDPYQTRYMFDGNIETYLFFTRQNGTQSTVNKLVINCSQRMYQGYRITNTGGWELSLDWREASVGSVAIQWIDNLCLTKNSDGDTLNFIMLQQRNDAAGQYVTWYWVPDKSFKPAINNGQAVKFTIRDLASNTLNDSYMELDCEKRKAAVSATLKNKTLNWQDPKPKSPAEYMLIRACRLSPAAPVKSEGSDSLKSAKAKCTEFGFKKGTEQYGNCVLKLSK